MVLEEIKFIFKNWKQEIADKYGSVLISQYEEPINTEKEKIFLIDVLLKKKVQLDDYGFVLSIRIIRVESNTHEYELTVELSKGDGKTIQEKHYSYMKEEELDKPEVQKDIYKTLSDYKILMLKMMDSDLL